MAVTKHKLNNKVKALMNVVRLTPVVQGGWVRAMSSYRLVPGDVVVLQHGRALSDLVLLQGTCLVNESMLSGEVCTFCSCSVCQVILVMSLCNQHPACIQCKLLA